MPIGTTSPILVPILGKDELSKKIKTVEKRMKAFKAKTDRIGGFLTRGVTLPLSLAGGASIKFAKDLNEGMANVATLIPGNLNKIKAYKKSVQDLAVAHGKSTDDIVEGLYETISAYGDNEETVNRLDAAVKAGIAGRASTLESVKLLTAVTKGYGDTTAQALKKVSDLSFLTVKLGQTNFPELSASIGKVVPLAKALNISQEELFSTFATLTGVTGNAAEVSTQMASAMSAMLKPSNLLTKTVKKLGYDSASAMMKQEGFYNTLVKLNNASGGLKETQKAIKKLGYSSVESMVKELGFEQATEKLTETLGTSDDALAKMLKRKEGLIATLALLGGQSDTYKKKNQEMTKAILKGLSATDEAYKEQMEGINKTGKQFEKTKARLMVFAQRIGDRLLPIMERLFDRIEPWLKKLEKLDDKTLDFYLKIAGFAMVAGPAIKTVGGLASAFGSLYNPLLRATNGTRMLSRHIGNVSMGMEGVLGSNMSKFSKFLTILKGAGMVLGAGAIGYGAGTLISKIFLEPQAAEKAKQFQDIQARREEAIGKTLKVGTVKERVEALDTVKKDSEKIADTVWSLENFIGQATSVFSGAESPLEKIFKETKANKDAQIKLMQSIINEVKTKEDKKTKVQVTIKNDSEKEVETKIQSGQVRTILPNTGRVMDGV